MSLAGGRPERDAAPGKVFAPVHDWEFNVIELYNYRKPGPFDLYFDYIRLHDKLYDGDVVESGVFRGKTLLAAAMLLKEIGSSKKVYGFDSFSGFPPVIEASDDVATFDELFRVGAITAEHYAAVARNINLRNALAGGRTTATTISSSGNFANTSRALIEQKIKLLGLDNIVLVEGPFDQTMRDRSAAPAKIFAALFDCDLYKSHLDTFNFVWSRLNKGGLCQLDEYYSLKFPGARIATDEFLRDKDHYLFRAPVPPTDEFERWAVIKR